LAECKAAIAYSCKDFPFQEAVRLQLRQSGSTITGTFEGFSQRSDFVGIVTHSLGIAGAAGGGVSVRLMLSGDGFTGYLVRDLYNDDTTVYMTKKYDIVVALTRQP